MDFIYIDLIFLALFVIIVSAFLYLKRKNVQVESKIFLLYRTQIGIKIINKLSKILPIGFLSYVSIFFGYVMMFASFFLFYYLFRMMISSVILINVPPVMPLIPYLPQIFNLTFLPPFYFTYWIITILIIAVSHEFSHGIFARFYNIKLKSTGFGFLGPFLAAFVELDEKAMAKKKSKAQMAILSGGPFANLLMTVVFLIITNLFFAAAYAPSGVTNYIYAVNVINMSSIEKVNGLTMMPDDIASTLNRLNNTNASIQITVDGTNYLIDMQLLGMQNKITNNTEQFFVYYDSPAYRSNLSGPISKIGNEKITGIEKLNQTLWSLQPNQVVNVETLEKNYTITLGDDPNVKGKAFLGISPYPLKESLLSKFLKLFIDSKKDSYVYYAPKSDGDWGNVIIFIYNLLFWIVLINLSVGLFNMVPLSVFDGGRFFYITMLSITKNEKKAMKLSKIMSSIIGWFIVLITAIWFVRWIF
jgi:membrane-associated protease RseP (regulator of RpoE activity)